MKFSEYLLSKAESKTYTWMVFVLTVCESIFLFIPPEVFMTPPIVANKKRTIPVVLAATLGSVIGGIISFCIGLWLYNSVGIWLIENFASMEKFELAQQLFQKNMVSIVFLTAVTPVPYKLMAIAAGFMAQQPDTNAFTFAFMFLGLSAIFRTGRFAIMGYLLWRFQERANAIVKKYFWPLTFAAIIIAGIGAVFVICG
ncbi:MAG: VTT domain-containing protein [Alphaproteobacteria bacterium]|nr:VTT domain-containing protein [Alphaproteobacteria bacterium]